MQVSVEATSGLERRMTVEVPDERIEKEVQSRLSKLAQTAKIKGFRPGKVPLKVIAGQYGDKVRQDVIGEVLQASFYEAVGQNRLQPAGNPSIEPMSLGKGQNLRYVATFEVMPEVEPVSLAGVRIEKAVCSVAESDIDDMMETLRKQHVEWEAVERPAQDGDRVVIDFVGTTDGEEFKGNRGENVPVVLGANRMIDGFEAGLVGAAVGEERALDLSFPADYGYKEVAGKPVRFAVTVRKVEQPRLPVVDEAFSRQLGVKASSVEALRAEVRRNMERELNQSLHAWVKKQVMDKLLELNGLDVPTTLVHSEAEALMKQMRQNMYSPEGKAGPNLDPSMFVEQATQRVKLGLIMSEIIKRNGLKADPARVRAVVDNMASSYEQPQEVVNWYYSDKRHLADVESVVLEDQVVEWALGQAAVEEIPQDFAQIMNRGRA